MFKKMMVLFVLAFSLTAVAAVANPQMPVPPCLPCGGGGN
jgi:hypothetical protein